MNELLILINLWCQPMDFDPQLLTECRISLITCVQPEFKKFGHLTPETFKCFEKVDRDLKKSLNPSITSHVTIKQA